MSQSELKKQIEDARLEVMESDKEIALIRSKIRNLPSSDDSSDLNFNSLVLIPTKITGLPESAEPKISIQCSSPIEECTVNFNLSGGSDSNITFTDVDVESATLTVSLSDKDLKLGSSAVLDIKPWTEVDKDTFDYVNGNQVIQDLAVAIVSDDETVTVPSKESDSGSSNTANLKPIILCGPSGAGKGTLINKLFEAFPDKFGFSVSHTTRKPREGEEHGIHYNFTSVEVMKQEIDDNKFIEYAQVHGNYYGTSVESVEKVSTTGKICVLDIDVQGVQKVKNSHLDATYIFIAPPSMETLESRLRGRGTEKEDDIQKRLANAIGEIEYGQSEGNFDKYLINDDLETAIEELIDTVKDFYPHLSSSMNTKELESSVDPAAAVLVPKFLIHFRILYHPSINAKKEMLYDALSKASKHKAVAVENLRKSAAALNRLMTEESEGNEEGDDDDYGRKKKNPILKSGFLNRKKSTKIEPPFFVRWYNKTLGPNSFVRRTYPIAKNYIIFFGGVVLMHFQGHQLALPPPV